MNRTKAYSIPALKRMPAYLRELRKLQRQGVERVSSPVLAKALRIDTISARKDVEMVGSVGSPGIGYRVDDLVDKIEQFLGWKNTSEAFLVGSGLAARMLAGHGGLGDYGLRIVAAFGRDPAGEGETLEALPLFGMEHFRHYRERLNIRIGILCVGDDEAQEVAEEMVEAGILAIWNFTGHTLQLPEHIIRQRVNLGGDFAVLSVKLGELLDRMSAGEISESGGEAVI